MELIKQSQIHIRNNGANCKVEEYPTVDPDLNQAVVLISGRYPDIGMVYNSRCKMAAFVVSGSGCLVINGLTHRLDAGDVVVIKPSEQYYWEGIMSIVVASTPSWYPQQHHQVC